MLSVTAPQRRGLAGLLAALVAASLVACGGPPTARAGAAGGGTLVILAAANLTGVFNALKAQFEQSHPGVQVKISYAGTQILQEQLQQGDPADVFVSADRSHMRTLLAEHLVTDMHTISADHEVVVVPPNNPAGIRSFKDLATKPVKLVIGVNNVPIGQYTRRIFQMADTVYGPKFDQQVMRHVVSLETDVKEVLVQVQLGQADAGIVYVTDVYAKALRDTVRQVPIPARLNLTAVNQMAIVRAAPHPTLAREWAAFVLSPAGQAVFRRFGYQPAGSPAGG